MVTKERANMKYLVIGAGGTGGCIGAYLAHSGQEVSFIARGEHLAAICQHGLQLKSARIGSVCIHPVHAYTMDTYTDTPDVVFVCVKYYSLKETIEFLNRIVSENTLVIPILNVFGTGEVLAKQCPKCTVLDGCIYIYSMIETAGVITQPGGIFKMYFGYRPQQEFHLLSVTRQVETDLKKADIDAHFTDNILKEALQKFSFVSPMGAAELYYHETGSAFMVPGAKQDMLLELIREVQKLGQAMGIQFEEDLVTANLAILKRLDDESTTSMVRDVAKGGPSEIDGLVHRVVRLSKQFSIEVPAYETISQWAIQHKIQ